MKNLIPISGITLFFIVALSSCSPKYYAPNRQNVPLLSKKNEAKAELSTGNERIGIQTAMAITNQLAIQLNGGIFKESDDNNDNKNNGSGYLGEIGFGFFKEFSPKWIVETYALGAFGSMENHLPSTVDKYPNTKGDIYADLYKFGLQPSIGYKSKYFDASFSTRISNLRYNNIKGDLIYRDEVQAEYLKNNSSTMLLEPAITLAVGYNMVKVEVQYGLSLNLTNNNFRQKHTYFGLGLSLRLGNSFD